MDRKYPQLRSYFDRFLLVRAPRDVKRDILEDLAEFSIDAAILTNDGSAFTHISYGKNNTNRNKNSLDHAEKCAIENALKQIGDKHLPPNAMLISSVDPCAMCASAFIHAGGKTLIYGAPQQDLEGIKVKVNGTSKNFRAEPHGYHVEDFVRERDGSIQIYGGYRKYEVVRHLQNSWGV